MRIFKYMWLALAVAVAIPTVGSAADLGGMKADSQVGGSDTPLRKFSWTGVYVSGDVGGVFNSHELGGTYNEVDEDVLSGKLNSIGNSDVFAGLGLGVRYQFNNNIVVGARGSYHWSDSESTLNVDAANLNVLKAGIKDKDTTEILAELGYAANRTLFYVNAGYGWTDASYRVQGFDNSINWHNDANTEHYILGGGVEYAFTDRITAGVRYDHWFSDKFVLYNQYGLAVTDDKSVDRVMATISIKVLPYAGSLY